MLLPSRAPIFWLSEHKNEDFVRFCQQEELNEQDELNERGELNELNEQDELKEQEEGHEQEELNARVW